MLNCDYSALPRSKPSEYWITPSLISSLESLPQRSELSRKLVSRPCENVKKRYGEGEQRSTYTIGDGVPSNNAVVP